MVTRRTLTLIAAAVLPALVMGLAVVMSRQGGSETHPSGDVGPPTPAPLPTPVPVPSPTPVPPRWDPERWQKGFALWERGSPFGSPEGLQSLQQLRDVGADTISPVITWYVAGPHDPHLHRGKSTPNEDELVAAIDEAHRQGLQVVLRFHVDCEDGTWRANIDPQDKEAFFAAYGTVIAYYARLAEEHQVEGMVIGAELSGLSGPANTPYWRSLIARVRQQFDGFLTYSAQWGSAPPSAPTDRYREFQQIEFWDDLDYLGISAYFELADGGRPSPSTPELLARWEEWRRLQIEPFQARYGKPLLFTEVGYPSSGEAARHPWAGGGPQSVNLQLQAELYSALFQSWSGVPWFRGAYFWFWPTDGYGTGPASADYPPAGKPAEGVIRRWYRQLDDMERGGG
ncbi:MAG: glycoside hydrolase family 113 [Chloroflexota bacterium]